jgi:hypothetical protein
LTIEFNGLYYWAAEKVGLPTPPPYLSLESNKDHHAFLTGVNFASGGAGIFDGNDKLFVRKTKLIYLFIFPSLKFKILIFMIAKYNTNL